MKLKLNKKNKTARAMQSQQHISMGQPPQSATAMDPNDENIVLNLLKKHVPNKHHSRQKSTGHQSQNSQGSVNLSE